jgi:repressor LexA
MVQRAGDHFALRVRGDSMVEAGILDGDLVVVRRQATAEEGETVVALVDGLATVKRLRREGMRIWLVPANAALASMEVTGREVAIRGVVVGVVRYL